MVFISAVSEGREFVLEAHNHAGDSKVCAGVSAIIYALAGWCDNEIKEGHCIIELAPGSAFIGFKGGKKAETAYDVTVLGLKQIERSHPDEIVVELRGKKFKNWG